jgi:predicted MFS family arabinose efflux permease
MNAPDARDAILSPLADPAFRRLYAAQVVSLVGTGLSTVALVLLAYELAGGGAGAVLGTALAVKMVAYVGIAPMAGALAHRLPRKALLVGLDLARAAAVCLLPFVDQLWQVYALIFLVSACSAAFTPLFQATIPDLLVEERRYVRALSLSRMAYEAENLLSPTVAALLLTVTGFATLFFANAATFLVSAALVLGTRLPAPRPAERPGGLGRDLAFGIVSYLRTPQLRGLLLVTLAAAMGGAMVIVNTVVYVRGLLGGSEADTAAAFMAVGGGALVAVFALPRLVEQVPLRALVAGGGAVTAVALAAGTAAPGFAGLLALWFVIGAAGALVQTPAGRVIVSACREADRAAFFSAHFALSHLCWLAAYVVSGWLGRAAGLGPAFAATAAAALAATIGAMLVWPRMAGEAEAPVLAHEHAAMEHEHLHVHDEHHRHDHEGWEGPEPHVHPHGHAPVRHRHPYVVDPHHPFWPR